MLRAVATLSVLAAASFAFSSAVAFMIATHASPVEAAPMQVLPAVQQESGVTCPALPEGAAPRCPALRGGHPSTADVVEAARRAGCPAFSAPTAPEAPRPSPSASRSVVTASHDGARTEPVAAS